MNFLNHCVVAASHVEGHQDVETHVLKSPVVNEIAREDGGQESHPETHDDVSKRVPLFVEVSWHKTAGGMHITLGVFT
jgi:hypothetical protein